MRAQMLVATFVFGLAASASAQVVSSYSPPAGNAADLLSRAARMAADTQRRFVKPPVQPSGWLHGTSTAGRPATPR